MKSITDWDWVSLSACLGVIITMFGFLLWIGRQMMSRSFVSHTDHQALGVRLSGVEYTLASTATKTDLGHLEARLRPVETGVAVLASEVQAVKEGVNRTEHMVSILLEHQIAEGRKP